MATYRIRLKRPVWDDITPITTGYSFTDYTVTGGNPAKLSNLEHPIEEALGIAANITNKALSINDLNIIGNVVLVDTIYALQEAYTINSPLLCFHYGEIYYLIQLLIANCGY